MVLAANAGKKNKTTEKELTFLMTLLPHPHTKRETHTKGHNYPPRIGSSHSHYTPKLGTVDTQTSPMNQDTTKTTRLETRSVKKPRPAVPFGS